MGPRSLLAIGLGVAVVLLLVGGLLLGPALVGIVPRAYPPGALSGAVGSVASAQTPEPPGITVIGTGMARGTPDIAFITVGVESNRATAQEAQRETADKTNAVVTQLRNMGVAEKDLRTSGLNLSPVFGDKGNMITGYRATNDVRVTVQEIGRTGELMDAAVTAGANRGGQISTGFKDDSRMRLEALDGAMRSAQQKAEALATAAGVSLAGVESITEDVTSGPQPTDMGVRAAPAAAAPSPVLPGELSVSARVRVTFRLR